MNDGKAPRKKLAHFRDPCVYCKQPMSEVGPGECPAFDRIRPPMAGEWFLSNRGNIEQARFDFIATAFPVFKSCPLV
jgi:hypothetical protein